MNPGLGGLDKQLAGTFGVTGYPSLFVIPRAGSSPIRVEDGVARDRAPDPSKFTESCKRTIVSALWSAGGSVPGPETPDLDRALEFGPDQADLWLARGAIR